MTGQLTPERLAELRATAKAATPGPWYWEPPSEDDFPTHDQSLRSGGAKARIYDGTALDADVLYGWGYDASGTEASAEDRAHIATFDPTTVLALLDELNELHSRLAKVESIHPTQTPSPAPAGRPGGTAGPASAPPAPTPQPAQPSCRPIGGCCGRTDAHDTWDYCRACLTSCTGAKP